MPIYACPSRRSGAATLGGKSVSLIDYASAQPCTDGCPGGSPGCPYPVPRYNPRDSAPITPATYELNLTAFWGGTNMNGTQQDQYQVYDGVIVRYAWLRYDPLITHGVGGGEWRDAADQQQVANQYSEFPTKFAKLTKEQLAWLKRIEREYYRPFLVRRDARP